MWPVLQVLGGLAILAALLWRLGTGAFVEGLRVIDAGAVVAALGIGLLTTVFSAWRWCLVARRVGLPLRLGTAVADYYRSLFLNATLPGGVLGDVHRGVRHGQHADDLGRGVRAVVLERTAGQVVVFAAAAAVLLSQPSWLHEIVAPSYVPVAVGLFAAVVAFIAWARSSARGRQAVATVVTEIRGVLARDTWPGIAILSAATLLGHLALFLVSARVAGVSAPVSQLVPLMVLALLAMGLPVNVGGWGPREGVTAWAFGAAGLGATHGLTVAVVYGVLAFVASLPGAGVLLLRRGRPQVELEKRVGAEGNSPHRRPQRISHPFGAPEVQAGHAVAQQHRRDGDV
ncbi:lysylphosphatidylglycerol synthase transmembrane domain-containing protein [Saccharopolyspora soli]|uniref:lysylphosphatidylglycerol synthase transmembrane domain-containing protein n=1 Tax=Saccharopolyspora soli TaxID=2926618 RepID=UPI001F562A37|nr:lysylphosphatidylglycerol synthase transmembrane domain-containing protein [Saccharopolyspora soli]